MHLLGQHLAPCPGDMHVITLTLDFTPMYIGLQTGHQNHLTYLISDPSFLYMLDLFRPALMFREIDPSSGT